MEAIISNWSIVDTVVTIFLATVVTLNRTRLINNEEKLFTQRPVVIAAMYADMSIGATENKRPFTRVVLETDAYNRIKDEIDSEPEGAMALFDNRKGFK